MLEGNLYEVITKADSSADVHLLPDSPIFRAHFPGYPITPGVTLVQMALEVMGAQLKGARDIKFVDPIFPTEDGPVLCIGWSFREDGTADVSISRTDGTLCAKMSLSV